MQHINYQLNAIEIRSFGMTFFFNAFNFSNSLVYEECEYVVLWFLMLLISFLGKKFNHHDPPYEFSKQNKKMKSATTATGSK